MAGTDVMPAESNRHGRATSQNHNGRHEHLIAAVTRTSVQARDLDAIIVPTGRRASVMVTVIELAATSRCNLLALCSKNSDAAEVAKLARQHGVKGTVIDANTLPPGILPRFATNDLLARTPFKLTADTSQKRNLALVLARSAGWQRVVLLDDDIAIPDPEDLRVAARLTEDYAGVGLAIDPEEPSFPDNSVVCHAYRDAGGDQGMFIGGGALAVGAHAMNSFFPNIYNEDWFFLLGEKTLRPVTMTGRALQRPYDPYTCRRAQGEELGDCLAEGLFWLLDNGRTIEDADERYWEKSLARRLEFIAEVDGMVREMKGDNRRQLKMLASLRAAKDRCERITPKLCTDYMSAWQDDRKRWRDHLDTRLAMDDGEANIEKAVSSLGLTGQSCYLDS